MPEITCHSKKCIYNNNFKCIKPHVIIDYEKWTDSWDYGEEERHSFNCVSFKEETK